MGKYCGCKVKPRSYRQMAVGIGREHIVPLHLTEDNTIDEAAHHGGQVARGHYGTVEGDLPYLTADSAWQHRIINGEWHDITGVGMCPPPTPLRLLARDRAHPPSSSGHGTDPSSLSLEGFEGTVPHRQLLEESLGRASEIMLAKVKRTLMDEILPAMMEKIGAHRCAMVAGETESGGGGIAPRARSVQSSSSGSSL
jgi:hypothetical protein